MLTRNLAVAFALALASTGAFAATTHIGTDIFGRPIVHTTPVDGFGPFDEEKIVWLSVHPEDRDPVVSPAARTEEHETGAQMLQDDARESAALEHAGFPQYVN